MKDALLMISVAVVLIAAGCASGSGYVDQTYDFGKVQKVAVVSVSGQLKGAGARQQIASWTEMELLKNGYGPIERQQINEVLEEQEFQRSEITTPDQAARAGEVLNVPVVVMIAVPRFGERISMTAKMVDVETGSIVWIGEGGGTTGKTLSTIAGAAVGAGAGYWAGGDSTGKAVGAGVGGVLGGVAGNALSPREAGQARKVIRKMFESLPAR